MTDGPELRQIIEKIKHLNHPRNLAKGELT